MKKYILTGVVILIALGVIKYEIPRSINKIYDGLIMKESLGKAEKLSIELDGELDRNIFKQDEVRGTIKTEEFSYYIISTKNEDKVYKGPILELDNQNGRDELLGYIYLSNNFRSIYIHFNKENSYFAAPTDNVEDMEKILKWLELESIK